MSNDNKRAKNSQDSSNNPNASGGSDRSNQGQGGNTQNQGEKVTREVVTKATMEGVEVSRGEDTTPMRTKIRVVDPVVGVTDTTPAGKQPSSFLQGKNLRFDDVAAIFDNDTHNLMDVHVEEQPHVRRIVCKNSHIVCEEFLHDPFILPSHHLNVTVIVQDKEGQTQLASCGPWGKPCSTPRTSRRISFLLQC